MQGPTGGTDEILLALALLAAAQEDISGLGGKLAEALATDAGIQAVQEKIDFLLAARISRFERDSTLFSTDGNGDLRFRPERRPDIDVLVRKLPLAPRAMSGFSRRAR